MNDIEPTVNLILSREINRHSLTLRKYRRILNSPHWGLAVQAIVRTRDYDAGLEGVLELLGFTEENKERLARKEYEENLRTLCLNALDLLDRSDQWESYLELWRQIRENTALTVSYSKQAIDRSELASFIIGETDTSWKVHFLFTTSRRKELIERKLKGRSEVWFGDSFLGKKRIDWKYRRISVGPRQGRRVPSTKVKFQLSLKGGSLRAKFS